MRMASRRSRSNVFEEQLWRTPGFFIVWTICILGIGCPPKAAAQWEQNGIWVTSGVDESPEVLVSDGSNGAFVVIPDRRSGMPKVYVQRLDSYGVRLWGWNAVMVGNAPGWQYQPAATSDGAGGVYVVWYDHRTTPTPMGEGDLYVQHVLADGSIAPGWPASGLPICTAAHDQDDAHIVPDAAGGAIVVWSDRRGGTGDIYAQRVAANGQILWQPDGVPVGAAVETQYQPQAVPDGAGGAVIEWLDYRAGDYDLYAQRIGSDGSPKWQLNGVPVSTGPGYRDRARVASDGDGGLVVVWFDGADLRATRVTTSGGIAWLVPVCAAPGTQQEAALCADSHGGVIVAWTDSRSSSPNQYSDIYAQRISFDGVPSWGLNGIPLCTALQCQEQPEIVGDGFGGAFVSWADARRSSCNGVYGDHDIYALRVTPEGERAPGWPHDGLLVCDQPGVQEFPRAALSGSGVILAWTDLRYSFRYDAFAQRVSGSGAVGVAEDAPLRPVLMVHGICSDGGVWADFGNYLVDQGFRVYTVTLTPSNGNIASLSAQVDAALEHVVAQEGVALVNVVAHSMGGLVTRYYVRGRRQESRISTLVTLGTPHHGSDLASYAYKHPTLSRYLGSAAVAAACLVDGPAIADLRTGSGSLNVLNYDWPDRADNPNGHDELLGPSRGEHESELVYDPKLTTWCIAGTHEFTGILGRLTRAAWTGPGSDHESNDGLVGVSSSRMYDGRAVSRRDQDLGLAPLPHFQKPAFYSTSASITSEPSLFPIVATLLRGGLPPFPVASSVNPPSAVTAESDSSVSIVLSEEGALAPGQIVERLFVIASTGVCQISMIANGANFRLRSPGGTSFEPADTTTVPWLSYEEDRVAGLGIFTLQNPPAGSWTAVVDGSALASTGEFAMTAVIVTTRSIVLDQPVPVLDSPGAGHLRMSLRDAGVAMPSVTWSVQVTAPDGPITILPAFDDGLHDDAGSGDGIFSCDVPMSGPMGQYRVDLHVTLSSDSSSYLDATSFALESIQEVGWTGPIHFGGTVFVAGDSTVVSCTLRNLGEVPVANARVEFRDNGSTFAVDSLTLAAGESRMVSALWHAAQPDTHTITLIVNPFSVPGDRDASNNVVPRRVVLGRPLDVGASDIGRGLRLGPIAPNPSLGEVLIAFSTPSRAEASLEILDVQGRRIRRWLWSDLPAGPHSLRWDGTTANGSRAQAGVLFVRLREAGRAVTARFARIGS